ncbi:SDR family NAD(P)-dependent oxidoreductase [Streptomyces albireticuli]|uniref:SDR family NAD(P)-dependent oxidoreductase n=1 Tax=Streptomyces albireticuli TaxID=1940 RepID=UPI0036A0E6A5
MTGKPVSVVTGAAHGIGRETAIRLAAEGFFVVAADRDEAVSEVAELTGGRAVHCDVTDPEAVQELADGLDRLDVLVNNAGVWEFIPLAETTVERYRRVMDINVLGSLLCLQTLTPVMARSGGGSIINLTSFLAETTRAESGIYPAAKAAINALTRQAAVEYAELGIRVNAVGPGMIQTEGAGDMYGPTREERDRRGSHIPLGRIGRPQDISGVIAFLASDEARYVTGQVLYADGGIGLGTMKYLRQAWAG